MLNHDVMKMQIWEKRYTLRVAQYVSMTAVNIEDDVN